jgi:hypothetical protein
VSPHAVLARTDTRDPITLALDRFAEASLDLLQARLLLDRVDRKYLLSMDLLAGVLAAIADDYDLLTAAGATAATYRTQYFDTPDRRLYQDHRRGRLPRQKVRLRHHLDRRLTFLEVKSRRCGTRSTKTRLPRSFGCDALDLEAQEFLARHVPFSPADLAPAVTNRFRRVTLLGHAIDERVTIDCGLELAAGPRTEMLPGLVVLEIKQGRYSNSTPAVTALRRLHVRELAISKYCLALARLTPIHSNTFRPALRAVEQFLA